MIPAANLATIGAMALATYGTRLGGYFVLRNRTLGPRAAAVLEDAPGCVLIAVIAPYFVSAHPADLIALAIILVAAARLPMLATVLIAVASTALLRHFLP